MQKKITENYRSGLSGLQLPIPKYSFPAEYQKGSRLTYYASFFNSIEVNSSFYKIPMKTTVARWAVSVPDDFRFTFKLFKQVTHCSGLAFQPSDIENFIQTINHVGIKRGCLLVQFPPSLTSQYFSQLENLLRCIRIADPENYWNIAVEFRNKSWYNDDLFDLLRSHNVSLVIHDIPASASPVVHTSPDFIYVRFHGPTGNYRGSYTESFLYEYTEYVKTWITEGKKVYVYFNNTAGDAFNNLSTFNKFLAEQLLTSIGN